MRSVAGSISENVGKAVSIIKNIYSITVNLVWYSKWTKNMMSEEAKFALGII